MHAFVLGQMPLLGVITLEVQVPLLCEGACDFGKAMR